MRIVSQSAVSSYCHFLAPPQLMLPAPQIAGLLPARVPSSVPQITTILPRESLRERQVARWAAQDAELEVFLNGARKRLAAVCAEIMPMPARATEPFIWEVAS